METFQSYPWIILDIKEAINLTGPDGPMKLKRMTFRNGIIVVVEEGEIKSYFIPPEGNQTGDFYLFYVDEDNYDQINHLAGIINQVFHGDLIGRYQSRSEAVEDAYRYKETIIDQSNESTSMFEIYQRQGDHSVKFDCDFF